MCICTRVHIYICSSSGQAEFSADMLSRGYPSQLLNGPLNPQAVLLVQRRPDQIHEMRRPPVQPPLTLQLFEQDEEMRKDGHRLLPHGRFPEQWKEIAGHGPLPHEDVADVEPRPLLRHT